jgi:hypothetical protein
MLKLNRFSRSQRFEIAAGSAAVATSGSIQQGRFSHRAAVALKAWFMNEKRTHRGYVMNLSLTGAKLTGTGCDFPVGSRAVLKFQISPADPTIIVRVQVMRMHFCDGGGLPETAVQFLDLREKDRLRLMAYLNHSPTLRL